MGFDRATVHFLLQSKSLGISLDRFLMLGRQTFYITPKELQTLLTDNGLPCTLAQAEQLMREEKGYCEPFLKHIGAQQIDSMDISTYENATIVHDMNHPLPEELHGQFSLLLDGGSLEHVFNYPTAIANCLKAVRVGGHMVTITPANNLLGHGFYQFSPELLFRVFSPANGYKLLYLIAYEHPWNGTWYQVSDPQQVRGRVELTNSRPTYLIACAQRTAAVPIFQETPQQSDYTALWQESGAAAPSPSGWKQAVPPWIVQLYWKLRPFRPRYYQKLPSRLEGRERDARLPSKD